MLEHNTAVSLRTQNDNTHELKNTERQSRLFPKAERDNSPHYFLNCVFSKLCEEIASSFQTGYLFNPLQQSSLAKVASFVGSK